MTRILPAIACLMAMLPAAGTADTLVAARMIPSKTVLDLGDLQIVAETVPGALRDPIDAVGLETRAVLYPGRPILAGDLVAPAVVERNQIVTLLFSRDGITIATEGRSLDRAAIGDRVRVMNLSSRTTVSGSIGPDGLVRVGPSEALLAQMGGQ